MSDAIEVKGRRKRVAAKKPIVDEPSDQSDMDARKKVKVAKAAQKKGRGPVKKTVVEEAEPEEQDQPTEDPETLTSAAQPKKKKKTVAISSRDQFCSPDKDSEDEVVSPFANVATKNRRATMFVPSSGLLSDEEESTGDEQMGTSSTPVNKKSKKKSSKTVPKETEEEKQEEPKDENPNGTFVVQNSLAPDQPKPTIVNQPRRGGRARVQKTYQEDSADDMVPAKKVGRKATKKVTVAEEPTSPEKKDEQLRDDSADDMVPAKKVGRKATKKVTVAEEPTAATSPSPAKKDEELREDSADDMAPVPSQKKWVRIRRVDLKVVQPAGQPPLSRKKKEQSVSGASEPTAPVVDIPIIAKKAGKKKAKEVERDVEEGKTEKDEPAVSEKSEKKKGKAAKKNVEEERKEESEKKDDEDEGKSSVAPVVSSDKPVKKTKKGKAAKNSVADEEGEVHKEEDPEKEDRGEEKSVPVDVAKPKGRGRVDSKQKVTEEPADTENDSAEKEPKRSTRGRTQSAVSTKTSASNGKKRGKPETVAEENEGENDVFEEQGTQAQDAITVAKTEPAKKRGRVASAKVVEKADEPELSPEKTEKKGRSRKASKKH